MAQFLPSRSEVTQKIADLICGNASRVDISNWATAFLSDDEIIDYDPVVWEVILALVGADLISLDRDYLYDNEDFAAWAAELSDEDRQPKDPQ